MTLDPEEEGPRRPLGTVTHRFPLVSVITPTLNPGDRLERCLTSVEKQEYPNVEHIVVDGRSDDGTLGVLRSATSSLRWISEMDSGQSQAINKGIALSEGTYVTWLNADDELLPKAITRAVETFQTQATPDVVYGDVEVVEPAGRWVRKPARHITFRDFFTGNPLAQPGTFIHTASLRSSGGLDEELHLGMDFELWLRLMKAGARFAHAGKTLARFEIHAGSKSHRHQPADFLHEMAISLEKHGLSNAAKRLERRADARRTIHPLVSSLRSGVKVNRVDALQMLWRIADRDLASLLLAMTAALSPEAAQYAITRYDHKGRKS